MARLSAILIAVTALAVPAFILAEPVTLDCGNTPERGVQDLVFETVWDQPAEGTDFLLSDITDAARDREGNICIVDYGQKNLKIFGSDGVWKRNLGREGEGPGECRDARKVFFAEDGRYGILQAFPGAIVWLHPDGTPAGKARIAPAGAEPEELLAVPHAVQCGNEIYAWLYEVIVTAEAHERKSWIAKMSSDGTLGPSLYAGPPETVDQQVDSIDESQSYVIWNERWVPDGKGGFWVAPERDRYLLQRFNANGELILEAHRDYDLVVRNDKGRDLVVGELRHHGWSDNQIKVGRTAPVVLTLRLSDDGNLWVRLNLGGHDPTGDTFAVIDVITPDGRWLKQLNLRTDQTKEDWHMLDDSSLLILDSYLGEDATLILQRARSE